MKITSASQTIRAGLAAMLFAATAFLLLQTTNAATFSANGEAENGQRIGNYSTGDTVGASQGASVKFGTAVTPSPAPNPTPTPSCNLNATTASFSSQLAAASAGQTICLATGNYGNWAGTDKSVTIAEQPGAIASIGLDFNNGDSGFTLDGLTVTGGEIVNGAKNITIKNSTFTGGVRIDGVANANILFDHNTHNNINTCSGCMPARIHLSYSSPTPSGVTIQNSIMDGGNADGIQSGSGVNIIGNEFANIHENGPNDEAHTDPIQLIGATGSVVRGNYIHDVADGIVAYDGVERVLIENNVLDLVSGRWGIELSSDDSSIVRHNTLVYRTTCEYSPCGHIILDHKAADPLGKGTVIENNIAYSVEINSGSVAGNTKNMLRLNASGTNFIGIPVFVGGANPTTFEGFKLAAGSPGKAAASDGKDVGIN